MESSRETELLLSLPGQLYCRWIYFLKNEGLLKTSILEVPQGNNYIIFSIYKVLLNRHLTHVGLINDIKAIQMPNIGAFS